MKVALDVSPLRSEHQFRGIGTYTRNLLEALRVIKKVNFQVVLVENKQVPQDCDLIHYPFFDLFFRTLPLVRRKKTVVTIHDTTPLVFSEHYPPGVKGKLKLQTQKLALKTVDRVITDSKNSKKDIVKYLNYPQEKIEVVYLAPNKVFQPTKDAKKLTRIEKKYRLPKRFVLYVGDVNYNKNIIGLVKAGKAAKMPLVIIGKQAVPKEFDKDHIESQSLVQLIKEYGKDPEVIRLGFVSEEDLVVIYSLATVYCQPSFYEGFGLPVLEAMACGTPVVTSKKASLAEIAGKAAILVDPYDINDIANGLTVAVEDENLREELIKKGFEQAKKFNWKKVANETYKVYQKVVEKR